MSRFMTKDGTLRKRSEDVRQEGYQRQVETMVREMLDRGASIAEVAWSLQCIVGTAIESVRNESVQEGDDVLPCDGEVVGSHAG